MGDGQDEGEREDIESVAAEWIVRLGGTPSAADRTACKAWLAADPAHAEAFEEAARAWAALDALKTDPGPLRRVVTPPARRGTRRSKTAIVLILLIGCGFGILHRFGDPFIAWRADYLTGTGETRTVVFSDGSKAELGAETAIAIHFDAGIRRIDLLEGEAYFTVAPVESVEQRPFIVSAAGGRTKALGTEFNVEDFGAAAKVTAVEHRIEVSVDAAHGQTQSLLSPGDTVHYDAENGVGPIVRVDAARSTAWRRGVLVFDNLPLAQVIAKLNRYRQGRIILMSNDLAARRVSGVFDTAHMDHVVETIGKELGVREVSALSLATFFY